MAPPTEQTAPLTAPTATDGVDGACADSAYSDDDVCSAWMFNTTEEAAVIDTDGVTPLVNVQSASVTTSGGSDFVTVATVGLPNYAITFTQDDIDALNARPRAATDFTGGATTVTAGQTVDWGADMGFDSTGCTRGETDEGAGFWPPGPECPEAVAKTMTIPVSVTEATADCYTPIGVAGLMVNGVSIFNWTDGHSYNSESVWYNLAQRFEIYDVDVCGGHAAGGEYHHHFVAPCTEDQLGDDGSGHSPIYGYAPDGVALYGPWVSSGAAAQSCWMARDYDSDGPLGCGGTGERTCLLVDLHDPSQGTTATGSAGPTTSDTVSSLSGNQFTATSGYYFEDYYFDPDCTAQGTEYMDEHNGHDHDSLGYHYHMTEDFPYTFGPTYYGVLEDNGMVECQSSPYPSAPGPTSE